MNATVNTPPPIVHAEAYAAVCEGIDTLRPNDQQFASSLITQYRRKDRLSAKQWACMVRLAERVRQGYPAPQVENVGDFRGVVALFDKASANLKWPKIKLALPDGRPMVLSRAGERSRYPGTINVTDGGPYGQNVWYGRIDREGAWTKSRNACDEVGDMLRALADDPAGTAAAYGKHTGHCCFCRRGLTDQRSLDVGYGPVCAENFDLPWGA